MASESQSGFLPPDRTNDLTPTLLEEPVITEEKGTIIGRYELLEKRGEGGFGVLDRHRP